MTDDEKLAVLREIDSSVPDIYADRANGFKPDGATGVPDKFFLLPSITPIADYHDWLYWRGGCTEGSRRDADVTFYCLVKKMADRLVKRNGLLAYPYNLWRRARLRRIAALYFIGVRTAGVGFFTWR